MNENFFPAPLYSVHKGDARDAGGEIRGQASGTDNDTPSSARRFSHGLAR